MMVSNRGSVIGLLGWQWKNVLAFVALSSAFTAAHELLPLHPKLPTAPLAVVGAALGIFVSFRTNSAYARWWEGRVLWGRMVNVSRHFAAELVALLGPQAASPMVKRHIAYVHALRIALRDQDLSKDEAIAPWLEARELLAGQRNVPFAILREQYAALAELRQTGRIDSVQYTALVTTLLAMQDAQGGAERIKRTPMPRGYGFIAERLILLYAALFPLGITEISWWAVPVTTLVCLCFALISEAGRVLEDPFTMFWNGLPLAAIAKTIELNLRQTLGEREVEPLPAPNARGILM